MLTALLLFASVCFAGTYATPAVPTLKSLHPDEMPHMQSDLLKTAFVAQPTHIEMHEPTIAKLGDIVENIPTAVSHQSSTIVHSSAQRVTPIVAPAVRSYLAPALHTTVLQTPARTMLRTLPFSYQPNAALLHALYNGYHHTFAYGTPFFYGTAATVPL